MSSSDSEDDIPLSKRVKTAAASGVQQSNGQAAAGKRDAAPRAGKISTVKDPRSQQARNNIVPAGGFSRDMLSKNHGMKKAAAGAKPANGNAHKSALMGSDSESESESDSDSASPVAWTPSAREKSRRLRGGQLTLGLPEEPCGVHFVKDGVEHSASLPLQGNIPLSKLIKSRSTPASKAPRRSLPQRKRARDDTEDERAQKRRKVEDKEVKWSTLQHAGLLFPPPYEPHGVKMLYDKVPVELTPTQEEVASMYAVMLETDYMTKPKFLENFWHDFREILGKGHVIKGLAKCDFRPIYEHLMAERDRKKSLSKEEKQKAKEAKEKAEEKYKWAMVDGRKEAVGNFRVEPPGLFRGRGEHPKMGKVKRRIFPHDITINIGKGEPVPEHPYPGQTWAEVRHDRSVTWLAFWKDPINANQYKYVFLGANSAFKSESDLAKYEKARKLKDYVDSIRNMYVNDWESRLLHKRQMVVALYFIDKLALRAGHEKDEDEADTVGCCTLKVGNVECMTDRAHHLKFDFLGKDSIKYENEVEVHPRVYKLVQEFCATDVDGRAKTAEDQLFETMSATDLNNQLKTLMDGLSVKVFRTYNASITLDQKLYLESTSETVDQKKADYDLANRDVAVLCNHQRAVPKGHADQMQRLSDKLHTATTELEDLELELKVVSGDVKPSKLKDAQKKLGNESVLENKIAKKREQLGKLTVNKKSKDDLKNVALGTSKINYLDPRITVAWCKRNEVPIEKIFNKSLLSKFHWAMDVVPDFNF